MKPLRILKIYISTAVAICFLLSLVKCDDDDSCAGKKGADASFSVYSPLYYYDQKNGKVIQVVKKVEEDTFMMGTYVTMQALDSTNASFEWIIGEDPRVRTTRTVTLYFQDNGSVANPVNIKLKVKKKPYQCVTAETVDSLERCIVLLQSKDWPVAGKYIGADNNAPDKIYTIEISNKGWLSNLPQNCDVNPVSIAYGTAFEFAIGQSNTIGTNSPECVFRELDKKIGYLTSDRRTIVIEYEFAGKNQQNETVKKRIFKGVRQ